MQMNDNGFLSQMSIQEAVFSNTGISRRNNSAKLNNDGPSFKEILEKQVGSTDELKFSKHASLRLSDRNISLSDSQLTRLNEGTRQAGQKGFKDSLVLVDSLAFIVNVPNNTVITAMDQTETDSNIFTNIDGAVIA